MDLTKAIWNSSGHCGGLLKFTNLISLKSNWTTGGQKFPELSGMLISLIILRLLNCYQESEIVSTKDELRQTSDGRKIKGLPKSEALLPWFLCPRLCLWHHILLSFLWCLCLQYIFQSLRQILPPNFPFSLKLPLLPYQLGYSDFYQLIHMLIGEDQVQYWMKTTNWGSPEKSLELHLGVQSTNLL